MRLLDTLTHELKHFIGGHQPQYVILSHTWGHEEVLFEDLHRATEWKNKKGATKVLEACAQAQRDGYQYIWIDTCCIDKSSSAELSKAINSMFKWYSESDICYAFLADADAAITSNNVTKMSHCRYFTRGWTLQELIAPNCILFYDRKWQLLGDRLSLANELERITQLPRAVLTRQWLHVHELQTVATAQLFSPLSSNSNSTGRTKSSLRAILSMYSVSMRMCWAKFRKTSRAEDMAYSLMGLFDVTMPLLYGEGADRAFYRLQVEIITRTNDQSILAWHPSSERQDATMLRYHGLFARSPGEFLSGIASKRGLQKTHMSFVGGRLSLELLILPHVNCYINEIQLYEQTGVCLGVLDCVTQDGLTRPALLLNPTSNKSNNTDFLRRIVCLVGPNDKHLGAMTFTSLTSIYPKSFFERGLSLITHGATVKYNIDDSNSRRIAILEPSDDYIQNDNIDQLGLIPLLRVLPIVQPPRWHFQIRMGFGNRVGSNGSEITRGICPEWLMHGFISIMESQRASNHPTAPAVLLLWGSKNMQEEVPKPWCQLITTTKVSASIKDHERESGDWYRTMDLRLSSARHTEALPEDYGCLGSRFDVLRSESARYLEAHHLTVHANIRRMCYLGRCIFELRIVIM
ncbi:heterokaryon incompatibility protein-domain-containing protein [Xylariaceae sp. FL1651]|nr:heterokaryon incompatibility protein-domain-containing protein [Xylariaceae sp. FL1651]